MLYKYIDEHPGLVKDDVEAMKEMMKNGRNMVVTKRSMKKPGQSADPK